MHNLEKQVALSITFRASFCNNWPEIKIEANNKKVWQGYIDSTKKITTYFDRMMTNTVIISYLNKRNGPDIWDTIVDQNGNVLQDQHCVIEQILLDGAACNWIISQAPYTCKDGDSKITFGFMGQNGYISFEFPADVYQWVIHHRQPETSNYEKTSSLDYKSVYIPQNESDENKKIIRNIKQLLDSWND